MEVQIFDPREVDLVDTDIRSFLAMMSAPDQTVWDYEEQTGLPEPVTDDVVQAFRRNFLPNVNNHALWAKAESKIIGMVGVNRYTAAHQTHAAELGVGVAEAFQGAGLGFRLVSEIADRAKTLGLLRLEAYCFAHNVAVRRLLQRAGFVEEGMRRGAIRKGGKLYDESMFGLLLT